MGTFLSTVAQIAALMIANCQKGQERMAEGSRHPWHQVEELRRLESRLPHSSLDELEAETQLPRLQRK